MLPLHPQQSLRYKRSRFSTFLPPHYLYTPSHFYLVEEETGLWRVGFTGFATRMLGDFVEVSFDLAEGAAIAAGQAIGKVEGFKAVSDLYCVAEGTFAGGNPLLAGDPALVDRDEYGQGWLYRVRGRPAPNALDVRGYIDVLDATIDKMRDDQH